MALDYELFFVDTCAKFHSVMEQYKDKNIRIAYSGGADSDNLMFLARYLGYGITGVFYDTGLEYRATHDHVAYMQSLGFKIDIIKAVVPIPLGQKKYGSAWLSKQVSNNLERLQKHNFDFKNHGNLEFAELWKIYPNCKSALRWWCNGKNGLRTNIAWNAGLKEFLIECGLPFKVSDRCCEGAKKNPFKLYAKNLGLDLALMGIRKSEGGVRSSSYKACFVPKVSRKYAMYFPMFFWSNADKALFEKEMGIIHSKAYTEYGLKRTGCAGCPFGLKFEDELKAIDLYEPKLSKAVNNIFANPYEWTRKYKEFQKERKLLKNANK